MDAGENMKKFDESFQLKLRETVEKIESASHAEIVVAVAPRSARYTTINLWCGALAGFLLLTVMMFIPYDLSTPYIYFGTLYGFAAGYIAANAFPGLKRRLAGKKRLREKAEREAKHFFHENGIVETRDRIGILFFFSFFEKHAVIIPDRGAKRMLPPEYLEQIQENCDDVFKGGPIPANILNALLESDEILSKYIPRTADDINELPDSVRVYS